MDHDNEVHAGDAVASAQAEKKPKNWSLIIRLTVGVIIAALFLTFVFQNTESTTIEFLGGDLSLPTSLVILGAAAAGIVLWEVAGIASRRSKKKK